MKNHHLVFEDEIARLNFVFRNWPTKNKVKHIVEIKLETLSSEIRSQIIWKLEEKPSTILKRTF